MAANILVVEDQAILRMDIKEMLEEAGFKVIGEAGDGEKAIELAHQLKPDLIIMDIKMPRMNGLKASKVITNSLDFPILILTAYSQKEFVEQAKESNVVGYLVKPISEANLIPAVEIALAQSNRLEKSKDVVRKTEQKLESRKLIEKAKGVLMEEKQISEEKAYQMMRQVSMKKQVAMERLARKILVKYKKED